MGDRSWFLREVSDLYREKSSVFWAWRMPPVCLFYTKSMRRMDLVRGLPYPASAATPTRGRI